MKRSLFLASAALAATITIAGAQDNAMSFFITSAGPGNGADLGGMAGADAHCASLAEAAGSSGKTWAAYLSSSTENARDRIGDGPWFNAKGEKIANDVEDLHGDGNNISKETGLDEKGNVVKGRGDEPNRHDILTGSVPNGTVAKDQTCGDWTMSGAEGAAMVGHHDKMGPETLPTGKSWNAAHPTRGGCSQDALKGTGGDGLLYCFATN